MRLSRLNVFDQANPSHPNLKKALYTKYQRALISRIFGKDTRVSIIMTKYHFCIDPVSHINFTLNWLNMISVNGIG
ncbi:hypothetical protein QWZ16_16710 [Vibrio ostreicida]|uniref:Transposase DDE domain-containing protein n=1 Tax=Vibrio ostreicida TaxID=526588 RepID=A0ABT8BX73_9VIBR|nr:hypothetical protein [Vibrio ostreicida]MDN3611248.1 hypothetical protein [Vibrio ostreicida]